MRIFFQDFIFHVNHFSLEISDRWFAADDRKIFFQVDNPKKPKTRAYEQYEKYKKAKTMTEARELGATKKDLDFDRDRASWSSPVGEMISGFVRVGILKWRFTNHLHFFFDIWGNDLEQI